MLLEGLKDRFSRSWEITKNTFHVMCQDKEIIFFPLLASIFSIILFFIFVFPFFVVDFFQGAGMGILAYLGIFAFYFVVTFMAVFFNAGVVHIAKTRFEGGNATFMDGIVAAFRRLGKLISWSLLSATIGLILNILTKQARSKKGIAGFIGKLLVSLIGLAWSIVSIFVVPAIVIKNQGPIDALKSSVQTMKKTWGESLLRHYGLGLVKSVLIVVGIIIFLFPGILIALSVLKLGLIFIAIFFLYVVLVSIVFSSANTVFNTALFLYAESGKVPDAYSKEELAHAFVESPKD